MDTPGAAGEAAKDSMRESLVSDPRVYMAAEQDFLAWIRTGLALMGFGFVLARFGVFLRQIQLFGRDVPAQPLGASVWFGVALVVTGVVVQLAATTYHLRLVHNLQAGRLDFNRPSRLAIGVAILLALTGLATAIYLVCVSLRGPAPAWERNVMEPQDHSGIVNLPSRHSVDDTVVRLQQMLDDKHVTLFALIDHSGEAQKAGLAMRPTKLLIFGSPKAGTPVMIVAPSIALDLPLKLLVWEDAAGKVWMSFNSVEYLRDRHHVPQELVQNIAAASTLAAKAAQ